MSHKIFYEKLNGDLNKSINGKNKYPKGEITQENIDRLNAYFMEEIGTDGLQETLNQNKSLTYHYKKHVLKKNEKRASYNRLKYDYMSQQDYYTYAKTISSLMPDYVIDPSVTNIENISKICDDFDSFGEVLKIDYNLVNKLNNRQMFAMFNRLSRYSNYIDVCLVDKSSNEPITLFPISIGRFFKDINDFIGL